MTKNKILVMVPTYNENENVANLCGKLLALHPPVDVLFIDDASPDGTGKTLDELMYGQYLGRMHVIHRSGKLGVGSAHRVGIDFAYDHSYKILISMDCDGTHDPNDIPTFLMYLDDKHTVHNGEFGNNVVVGTRHMFASSLAGWSTIRKVITYFGHVLTTKLLGIPQDATGAFRAYRLDKIPKEGFKKIRRNDYAYFFEGLLILNINGFKIKEVPIILSPRAAGNSKLKVGDLVGALWFMLKLWYYRKFDRSKLVI